MPCLLIATAAGFSLLWFDEGQNTPVVHYICAWPTGWSATQYPGGLYIWNNNLLYHANGINANGSRFYKMKTPWDNVLLPTIGSIANRLPFMRVSG